MAFSSLSSWPFAPCLLIPFTRLLPRQALLCQLTAANRPPVSFFGQAVGDALKIKKPRISSCRQTNRAGLPKRAQSMKFCLSGLFGKFRLPKPIRNVNVIYLLFLCRHQPPPLPYGLNVWACWQCFCPHSVHRGHRLALPSHGPKTYGLAVARVTAGEGNVWQFFAGKVVAGGHELAPMILRL